MKLDVMVGGLPLRSMAEFAQSADRQLPLVGGTFLGRQFGEVEVRLR